MFPDYLSAALDSSVDSTGACLSVHYSDATLSGNRTTSMPSKPLYAMYGTSGTGERRGMKAWLR